MKTTISFLCLLLAVSFGCQQNRPTDTTAIAEAPAATESVAIKKGMIKVTILYPNADGKTFDMGYYSAKHMPMIATLLGDPLKLITIDKGIAGGAPGAPIPYLAIGYLYFENVAAFQTSFAPHAEKIRGDVQNYTNIQPVVLISEVLQ